ncbi:hypothetical protein F2Q70_00036706 [Brassica cretica]|uniref:Calcineurin-like phosphoesterase domain-containing protein n=1 Tax=Brassica cretica TaxID=69181 RepID=A0A8S9JYX1_BRACR|nr:hypothetical protein F2Q70_00036706 [Brassica cretica]
MKHHHKLTVALCLIWASSILYGEMFAFWVPSLFTCSWPHHHLLKSDVKFTKVAIVTDPQLMDKTSFRLSSKTLALEVAQFYTDVNMRRSFFQSVLPFKPDVVLFLGDYFDGGPFLPEEEWYESLSRFKHVFGMNSQGQAGDIPTFYIPGNHDIGYSRVASHKLDVINRYEKAFGSRNRRFVIGSTEFVSIDAQAIDGNPQKELASEVWKFVQNVSSGVCVIQLISSSAFTSDM